MSAQSGHSDISRKVALAAAAAAGAIGVGVGLYYLAKSGQVGEPQTKLEDMSALQLKELGNKLFAAKKYPKAVEVFSKAIESAGAGMDDLVGICYQNRAAAKEYIGGIPLDDIITDCTTAIERKPRYGKAYVRRARNEHKNGMDKDALIDLFSATHVDSALDTQIGPLLAQIVDVLMEEEKAVWLEAIDAENQVTPVRHERIYAWLHKITEHDPIRTDLLENKSGDGLYYNSLSLIRERNFGSVFDCALKVKDASDLPAEEKLKCMILAARFASYTNQKTQAQELLELFDSEFGQLIEPEQQKMAGIKKSRMALEVEMGKDKETVMRALSAATEFTKSEVDFYTTAAFRLTLLNDLEDAREVIGREDFEPNTNANLVRLMLDILLAVQANNMAGMHSGVLALENFVNELEPKTPYALSLLAKIYTLFQNNDGAKATIELLLNQEPQESIHHFDASMLSTSEDEMTSHLAACIRLEPHHAEANLMLCSVQVNRIGTRALTADEYDSCWACLERACHVITGSTDFPTLDGVFRMMPILRAKRLAAERFGV